MEETNVEGIQKISTFRRFLPQVLGSMAKNLMALNWGGFTAFTSIVLPSLTGLNKELNPDETVVISSADASWLASFAVIAYPIGSLLGGALSDKIGRRKTIISVAIPLTMAWIMLGFAYSFFIICLGFGLIGFVAGLKDPAIMVYVSEISEIQIRGPLLSIAPFFHGVGIFLVKGLGSALSWRQVAFISAIPLFCGIIASFFTPETPTWLLSKDRLKEAQKSLQWLRGWVSLQTVQKEFTELQNFYTISNACSACEKQSIKCYHPKPTFLDKLKTLKRKRNLKPSIFIIIFLLFDEFSIASVWRPYIIQVLIALGIPFNPNLASTLISGLALIGNVALVLLIKNVGRRKLYFSSTTIIISCCFGLSAYGFTLLPWNWTSFKKHPDDPLPNIEYVRQIVGNYSYLALALVFFMEFSKRIEHSLAFVYLGEVFPFKSRAYMSALLLASKFFFTSIAAKTYYNVEMGLSLPGALLFFGIISSTGMIIMYFIMPELEQRSLEDIELHYSDNSKGLTDIHIAKRSNAIE